MYHQDIIQAVGHTPLTELKSLSPRQEVRIFVKLEGQNPGGSASTKDRVTLYMLAGAEKAGRLKPGQTIIEATSGNTGISLAWLGRLKGYPVTIVMPECMSEERRRLIRMFGAELILTDGDCGMKAAIDTAYEMAARDDRYFLPDQFTNPLNPQAHYETTAAEILKDFPAATIDALVAGIGTGGTIMGVGRRLKEVYPKLHVYGAEPPAGDAIQGLKCLDDLAELPPFIDLKLIDERALVSSVDAARTARELLRREGIFAGLSSGAAVCQALKLAGETDEGNIVVVLPDGGWKYLSLDIWED